MIAHAVRKDDEYWYLDAWLFCELQEYRRPLVIEDGVLPEDAWEVFNRRCYEWEEELLGGYCEDLLEAYLLNGNNIKQVFVREDA